MGWLQSNMGGLLAVGLCVLVFVCYALSVRRRQDRWDKQDVPRPAPVWKEEPEEREYALQKVKATVVDLACGVRTVGLQPPKTITEFAVAFQSATGQVYRFTIPEEMYEGLEKGQTGILSFIDGELYGFDLGETEA